MAQKRFDYFAARQSGASDDDIAAYLAQRQAAGDSLYVDRKEVDRWNKSQQQAPAEPQLSPWKKTVKSYLDTLPWFGGGVGGIGGLALGGGATAGAGAVPGAIAGAGLGGALGEGGRELGYHALGIPLPMNPKWSGSPAPLQVAGNMAGQGTQQMIFQALGESPAMLAQKAALPLAQAAVRPTAALQKKFPNVDFARTALDNGLTSATGANAARQASSAEAKVMLRNSGATYTPAAFARSPQIRAFMDKLEQNADLPATAKEEARSYIRQWFNQNRGKRTAEEWYKAAQALQQNARNAYVRGQDVGSAGQVAASPVIQQTRQELASAIKGALGRDISGLTAQDARTQALIGTTRAFKGAQSRGLPLVAQAAPMFLGDVGARMTGHGGWGEIPSVLGAYLAMRGASDPRALATLAQLANSPATSDVLRQVPRFTGSALQGMQNQ